MKNLTNIMKEAHRIAKTLEGDYTARLSEGLKQAWARLRSVVKLSIQDLKKKLLWINACVYGDRHSLGYQISAEHFAKLELHENANSFVKSVCDSVVKYMKISEKQAYCLARFASENNINL